MRKTPHNYVIAGYIVIVICLIRIILRKLKYFISRRRLKGEAPTADRRCDNMPAADAFHTPNEQYAAIWIADGISARKIDMLTSVHHVH